MWMMAFVACEQADQGKPLARVKVQDSTPATTSTWFVHSASELAHTGLPVMHTGEPCGASSGLGWQVAEWQAETVADLEVAPAGSLAVVGRLLAPLGEALDVCAASCSEPWAVPVVSRPGERCGARPAPLPLLDVQEGDPVEVCVAVYDPGADAAASCEVSAGGWVQRFDVTAYCADC